MATLSTRRAVGGAVLVACPSAALVKQLIEHFSGKFWNKIGAGKEWVPDLVLHLLPSQVGNVVDEMRKHEDSRIVVVSTINALQQLYTDDALAELKQYVKTILFDEGHREPAPIWSEAIRSFSVPTVLFSATPFRSDLKIFDVDDDHIHFLSFTTASADSPNGNLIRNVKIEEKSLSTKEHEFARQVIEAADAYVADGIFGKENKVIVRANSEQAVRELHSAFVDNLKGRDDGVLAIHDNFGSRSPDGLLGHVPDRISERSERFLIHQFMLIEGIDDPACTMLALFDPFSNTRMLVQQIGRLIRHPDKIGTKAEDARVLARVGDDVAKDWESFLDYDKLCKKNGGKPFIRNDRKVLADLIAALPEFDYVFGKFRSRIDLDDKDIHDDLRFPLSALVFDLEPDFDLDAIQEEVYSALVAEDRFEAFRGETKDKSGRYHVSLRLTPSSYLADRLFHAASLEVTIYCKYGNRLFFYDSAGVSISDAAGVGTRVAPSTLRSYMPDGTGNAVSFLNVKNTDLGPLALRSRSLSAPSLEKSGVFMGEHMNVVTRAVGRFAKKRRAVGFSRGRVRQGDSINSTADEFAKWCEEVNRDLENKVSASGLFSRFAAPTAVPEDTTPVNILVDIMDLSGYFPSSVAENERILAEDLCADVTPDNSETRHGPYKFSITIDKQKHDAWIEWNSKKKKYWITSPSLSKIQSMESEKKSVSLTKRLNQEQTFRIITADMGHAYVDGSFYSIDLDLSDESGAGGVALSLITGVPGLEKITSEKGKVRGGEHANWEDGSLFEFIDKALNPGRNSGEFGPPFEAFVCDDLNDEVGDFLGVDGQPDGPRAVLIAAKWHKGEKPGVATSTFYDVCAQGLKNLAYMKSDGTPLPGNLEKFNSPWRMSSGEDKDKKTDLIPRSRSGHGSIEFRRLFESVRAAPSSSREVWLVCSGSMLSEKALRKAFAKKPPEAHVLQFYHLIMSTYAACQSVGVGLRVFCAE